MKHGFDLPRIRGDGTIILPLSMSRLRTAQSPAACHDALEFFTEKFEHFSNDAVLFYTDGLYLNSRESAHAVRRKTTRQALGHIAEFQKILKKRRKFTPGAIHFLPFDFAIFGAAAEFLDFFDRLKKFAQTDPRFAKCLAADARNRADLGPEAEDFLLEEIAATHLLRENFVPLPRTLAKDDAWRLVAYPGPPMLADAFSWRENILLKKSQNPFAGGQYDLTARAFFCFENFDPPTEK